jgi:hypothetical protein
MGRSHNDISSYKDEIVDLFNQQETNEAIRMELARRYSINKYILPYPFPSPTGLGASPITYYHCR